MNNATGTARNQIYFTAHSPNAKNLNLADEYSGQMVSIRPTYFMMLPHVLGQTRHIHFLRPIPNVLVVVMFGHI